MLPGPLWKSGGAQGSPYPCAAAVAHAEPDTTTHKARLALPSQANSVSPSNCIPPEWGRQIWLWIRSFSFLPPDLENYASPRVNKGGY